MLLVRSALFNLAFYLSLIIQMIIFTPPYFLMRRKAAWVIPKNWVRSSNWLMEHIVGTTHSVEGLENIPKGGYIIAPKHQSFWDAIGLLPYLDDPFYILKRELTWIPLFGWYVNKMRMVPINRGSREKVMPAVLEQTRQQMADGRQLIIYPEGTRRAVGAEPAYRYGIARIYSELDVPVMPVAVVAGLFWPRRKFLRYPGNIKVHFLPPIPPGLPPEEFMQRLIDETESAVDKLLVEAVRDNPDLPLPKLARKRYEELTSEKPVSA
ncbi:lysophospholipid acyltransferase family protein [Hoeflea prorocentri]|uniref:1-acyl-sn-glycerol-3-phosphate acyltransferase n=1 Tax=Hoeflea prorocentri TaxID=1922333 RepID=A0A9X3UN10_9HYPH|nr:1-acyl-sn-glycerol-3-phosphate acyltransferase [Hoeflea prorocentri]MCY6383634.1 1-acyl-sn-glycerol-3-phosphate acyltransferase [Hoeflea prorocentri]MDA5401434.1 1-acyl-sn-glycerol-3-phosphate acyltransferase [Hoeflea prorocentri]